MKPAYTHITRTFFACLFSSPFSGITKIIYVCVLLFVISSQAFAKTSAWSEDKFIKARLLSAQNSITKNMETLDAAVEIILEPEWHTYWRTPGDIGLPPQFDWENSENLKSATVSWPVPKRYETEGFQNFVFFDRVVLPVRIKPVKSEEDIKLDLTVKAMVCKDICIPQTMSVHLEIPKNSSQTTPTMSENTLIIEKAKQALPFRDRLPGTGIENVVVGKKALIVTAFDQRGFADTDIFVEIPGLYLASPPELKFENEKGTQAIFKIPSQGLEENLSDLVDGKDIVITLVNRGRAVEKKFQF